MTEAELIDAAQATWGNVISIIAILISLLSGYIVLAYVAAEKMTGAQVTIVNTLYILIYTLILGSNYTLTTRATEMAELSIQKSTERVMGPTPELPILLVIVFGFCLLASLKFMWDVRHPKTE